VTDKNQSPVCVITGGHGTLGKALENAFNQNGFEVYAPSSTELDVTSASSVSHFFSELPRLDVLIVNAGVVRDRTLAKMTHEEWDTVMKVNLKGAFLCSRAAARLMAKQRKGHIIYISSWAAKNGNFGQSNYAASKAGLIGLCQSMAKEYGKRNVQANVVLPGYFQSKITSSVPADVEEHVRTMHTLERFNTPENAAKFIAFVANLDHCSGQIFQLDSRIAPWT